MVLSHQDDGADVGRETYWTLSEGLLLWLGVRHDDF